MAKEEIISPGIQEFLKKFRKSRKIKWYLTPVRTVSNNVCFWIEDFQGRTPIEYLYPEETWVSCGLSNQDYQDLISEIHGCGKYNLLRHELLKATGIIKKKTSYSS